MINVYFIYVRYNKIYKAHLKRTKWPYFNLRCSQIEMFANLQCFLASSISFNIFERNFLIYEFSVKSHVQFSAPASFDKNI